MIYKTSRYWMVFAPFSGLNHHRQLICFRAGLCRDEKVESFLLLFNNFMIIIESHRLETIIMDWDLAIRQVITDVWYTSINQFYMWHIMRKFPEKVGHTLNDCEISLSVSRDAYGNWTLPTSLCSLLAHNAIVSGKLKCFFDVLSETEYILWDREACQECLYSHELLFVL